MIYHESILWEIAAVLTTTFALIGFIELSFLCSSIVNIFYEILLVNQNKFFEKSCCHYMFEK